MRYVWDQYPDYFGPGRASPPVRAAMAAVAPFLRRWDVRTAAGVDHFIANSENVRGRIRRFYGRDAAVIYPPVDTARFRPPRRPPEDFYLIVTAFAPYKRVDVALEAFRRLDRRLVVIGSGQEEARLRAAAGPRTEFVGWASDEELRDYYGRCRALIFPGEEDFGIVPVEAMACGRPVIAYGKGGALETVVEGKTGAFFRPQTAEALAEAVARAESLRFDPESIAAHARSFSREAFAARMTDFFRGLGIPLPSAS
jgi:glycosyltransferase involved in cell wall biosynthesis